MLPHMGPEFVEALATNRPATNTSSAGSQTSTACKRLDRLAPFQHVTVLVVFPYPGDSYEQVDDLPNSHMLVGATTSFIMISRMSETSC
jgi:hypothetical protein